MLLKLTDQQAAHVYVALQRLSERPQEGHGFIAADGLGHHPTMTADQLRQFADNLEEGKLEPTHADCISFHAARPDQTDDESEAFRSAAQEHWADDECEIDGDAFVSASDEGAFVAAWVWVSREEAGLSEEEGEDDADQD